MVSKAVVECPYNATLAASLMSSEGSVISFTLKSGTTDIATYTVDKSRYTYSNGVFVLNATKNESS